MEKIGFGGGCHWCTEAIFQNLKGVQKVEQGYISTAKNPEIFSEGIIVHYRPENISLKKLVEIHLKTHSSASDHRMRSKYLSAVYTFSADQKIKVISILNDLQKTSEKTIITRAYDFGEFKASRKAIQNYYRTDPDRPFCKLYIKPKLEILESEFPHDVIKPPP